MCVILWLLGVRWLLWLRLIIYARNLTSEHFA
jgi:hypothetical protein